MFRHRAALAVPSLLIVLASELAAASTGPIWSPGELAGFSDAIVTGRVADVRSGWDTGVNAIYTYVRLDVDEVFKGRLAPGRVTIKQLGGVAGDVGLWVPEQPNFVPGQQVLLFLETRPRDGTLYTTALSQGRWDVEQSPDGRRLARRGREVVSIGALRQALRTATRGTAVIEVETAPADLGGSAAFALMLTPFRYTFFPPVDIEAGGQPGLEGGGVAEIRTAIAEWNGAGSAFRYLTGSLNGNRRCAAQFLASYRVTISFMDPCAEISNSGGTLAIGGSYYSTMPGPAVNDRPFRLALEGFIINNDSSVALDFLRASGCFHDTQLHELGHVLGLGHSADRAAIMFPSLDQDCLQAPNGLAADDVQGLLVIYPTSAVGTPGQPAITRVAASGEILTVEWVAGPGSAPTGHRLDFFSGSNAVAELTVGPATSVAIPVPAGTTGVYTVQVTAFNGGLQSPPSVPVMFAINPACTSPPASPVLTGRVVAGTATVSWTPVPATTRYILQAGTSLGAADLVPATDLGLTTAVSASGLPPGFSAWVRVTAVNDCGPSVPSDLLVQ